MTVEEHSVLVGLGGAVAEVIAKEQSAVPLHRHGIRDVYSLIGPPTHLYRHYRLDAARIEAEARDFLNDAISPYGRGVGTMGYSAPVRIDADREMSDGGDVPSGVERRRSRLGGRAHRAPAARATSTVAAGANRPLRQRRQVSTMAVTGAGYDSSTPTRATP
jgi:hypothetical protein